MKLARSQILMLGVLIVGAFVAVLNQTIVAPALPSIMRELHVNAATAQWLTTGFTLANAIMIPITAYLTDRFSTKRLFLVSMITFCAGSLLAGWSSSFPLLLAGRLVQAIGAGILMPMVMTVLVLTFPVDKRGSAMGIFGLVVAFAPAIGPTLSGIVIDHASWHVMFYIVAGLAFTAAIAAAFFIEAKPPVNSNNATLDRPSVVLSTLGFGGLLFGFSDIGANGVGIPAFAATVVGLISLATFAYRQVTMKQPMLNISVLKSHRFLIGTIIGMIVQASLLAAGILMPIYIQTLRGMSAMVSGLVLLPGAIAMGAMGPIAGRIFDRHGPRRMVVAGMTGLTLSTLAFATISESASIFYITTLYTVRMLSLALVNMPITTWSVNSLDNRLINHGTSVNNTLRQVAGSLGTAIVISVSSIVGAAGVQNHMSETAATMLGINAAFGVCALLCAAGTVLAFALVKDGAKDAAEQDSASLHRSVLEAVMRRDIRTINEKAPAIEAVTAFIEYDIDAMPIVDDSGKPVGFISDGDVMRALASRHDQQYVDPIIMIMQNVQDGHSFEEKLESLMNVQVHEVGVTGVISVDIHAKLPDICRMLGRSRLRKLPVLDDGQLVGIVSRKDIARYAMNAYLEKSAPRSANAGAPEQTS